MKLFLTRFVTACCTTVAFSIQMLPLRGQTPRQSAAPASTQDVRGNVKVLFAKVGQDSDGKRTISGGGTMDVQLRVAPNASQSAVVAVSVPNPVAHNDSWQASAWMAAFVSARAKDKVLSDFEFSIIAPDAIDGPSAGMALTAGMLALMNGVDIRTDRALTGTINPDGTVGPVGGIIQKLDACKAAGISKFGYPVGQRLVPETEAAKSEDGGTDFSNMSYLDVEDHARRLDIEAVEIRDLSDAYRLLTDESSGLEAQDSAVLPPGISLAGFNKLRSSVIALREAYMEERKRAIKDLAAELGSLSSSSERAALIKSEITSSEEFQLRGDTALAGGAVVASYFHMLRALAVVETASNKQEVFYSILQPVSSRSITNEEYRRLMVDRTMKSLKSIRSSANRSIEELHLAIRDNLHSKRLVTKMEALSAYISMREAVSNQVAADNMTVAAILQIYNALGEKGQVDSKVRSGLITAYINSLDRACLYYALVRSRCKTAKDWYTVAVSRDPGSDVAVNLGMDFFETLGKAFSKGAQATLAYLDSTTRQEWADQLNRSSLADAFKPDFVKYPEMIALVEPRYLPISLAANVEAARDASAARETDITKVTKEWELRKDKEDNLDAFGSGASAFLGLSTLVLKYYNFQGDENKMLNSRSMSIFIDLARSKALTRSKLLEQKMLIHLSPADRKEAKHILPEALCMNIELADSLRYGDEFDKLSCLQTYWKAHMLADLGLAVLERSDTVEK